MWYCGYICYTCGLKARKQQKKRKKIFPSFANSMGQSCWRSWAFFPAKHASFANRVPLPTTLSSGFANSRCNPVGEGNGNRADGVLLSPTEHVAVGEAFPTGPAFLLAKSSFPSLKMSIVLSQQERANPVGKTFAKRIGVFANSVVLLAKRPFPVVLACYQKSSDRSQKKHLPSTFHASQP
jgi:hypothetical protein